MHVEVTPRRCEPTPGLSETVTVTVSNTGELIGGYTVRVLGADPSWVHLPDAEVTLFPGETRAVGVELTVPPGMVAGERRVAIQVREQTPPHDSVVEDVVLVVAERPAVRLRVDPLGISAGRTARMSLLIANEGNSTLRGAPHGQDPEGRVRFRFDPPSVELAPGENAVVDAQARARRPLAGSPAIRPLELRLLDPAQQAELEASRQLPVRPDGAGPTDAEKLSVRRRRKAPPRVSDDIAAQAQATFIQRPVFSRGSMSLVGLLAAVTVFALVITIALSRIVGQSAEDRNLALQIAAAQSASSGTGTAELGGAVRLLTSGKVVRGVSVSVFSADDPETALATTATDRQGRWQVGELSAGDYLVTFRGAGFVQLWFPQAITPDEAETLTLEPGARLTDLDATLGGVPATIAGTVVGPDVSNATVTLKAPLTGATALAPGSSATTSTDPLAPINPSAADAAEGATILEVPIGAEGTFELDNVPSPSVYDLVVEKEGFATSTQRIDVGAGEERAGIEIDLRQGDGVLSGTVTSGTEPLAGATVTATTGQTSVTSQSLSDGDIGSFALRGLPTPATFSLVITKEGYASQTLTVTLGDGQELGGLSASLDLSSGSVAGVVRLADPVIDLGTSVGGVLVTVTDGTTTVQTATESGPGLGAPVAAAAEGDPREGAWAVSGLPVPGEYTITFTRDDLATQTVAVSLDGQGRMSATGVTTGADGELIAVELRRSTAAVSGTVVQQQGTGSAGPGGPGGVEEVGEVTVQLVSNTATYSVITASVPEKLAGQFRFDAVPPGTYTLQTIKVGVASLTRIVTVRAGVDQEFTPGELTIGRPASVSGTVTTTAGDPVGPGYLVELYRSSEYPTTLYATTTTERGGSYRFDDVEAPQTYVVQVRRSAGSAPRGTSRVQLDASDDADVDVRVRTDG